MLMSLHIPRHSQAGFTGCGQLHSQLKGALVLTCAVAPSARAVFATCMPPSPCMHVLTHVSVLLAPRSSLQAAKFIAFFGATTTMTANIPAAQTPSILPSFLFKRATVGPVPTPYSLQDSQIPIARPYTPAAAGTFSFLAKTSDQVNGCGCMHRPNPKQTLWLFSSTGIDHAGCRCDCLGM